MSAVVSRPPLDFDDEDFEDDFELDFDDEDFEDDFELDLDDEDFEDDFELDFDDFEDFDDAFPEPPFVSACGTNGNVSSSVRSGTYSAVFFEVDSSSVAAVSGGVSGFPAASMENAFASSASI